MYKLTVNVSRDEEKLYNFCGTTGQSPKGASEVASTLHLLFGQIQSKLEQVVLGLILSNFQALGMRKDRNKN